MSIPPCQQLWILETIAVVSVGLITVRCVAFFLNPPVRKAVNRCGIIVALTLLVLLNWTQLAVYNGRPSNLDTMIGFPFVFAYAPRDARFELFDKWKLLTDAGIGLTLVGIAIVLEMKVRKRKAKARSRPALTRD